MRAKKRWIPAASKSFCQWMPSVGITSHRPALDTGVQDAAEVMHRLAPSGSMSLSTTRSQASPPRPGFVVGPRIG